MLRIDFTQNIEVQLCSERQEDARRIWRMGVGLSRDLHGQVTQMRVGGGSVWVPLMNFCGQNITYLASGTSLL